jgi:hypothetical protein
MRALFKDNEREFPLTPLDKKAAEKLEVSSRTYKEQFEKTSVKERNSSTFGGIQSKPMWE